jgi:hypothetical protein
MAADLPYSTGIIVRRLTALALSRTAGNFRKMVTCPRQEMSDIPASFRLNSHGPDDEKRVRDYRCSD